MFFSTNARITARLGQLFIAIADRDYARAGDEAGLIVLAAAEGFLLQLSIRLMEKKKVICFYFGLECWLIMACNGHFDRPEQSRPGDAGGSVSMAAERAEMGLGY
jgi:hypothetical protein